MTKRKRKDKMGAVKLTLAAGGVAATLVGADLMARSEWLTTVVDPTTAQRFEPSFEESQAVAVAVPTVLPYVSRTIRPNRHPPKLAPAAEIVLAPIPTVVAPNLPNVGAVASGVNQVNTTSNAAVGAPAISFGEIPQIAQPNIPNRPQINTSTVSVELPPIPEVAVAPAPPPPPPVTTSTSSK